jgi:hemerythrin
MSYLEWKEDYSVGIESMDVEHREMIELINRVYDELEGRRDAAAIEGFLGEVHSAISSHFALEERIMREASYEEYDAHKNDHEELLDKILDMMDASFENSETGLVQLEENLSSWFGNHFSTFDARLHGKLGI